MIRGILLFCIGLALCAAGSLAADPEQVARVMDGTLKEARASWWGFDKDDSTRALQAAIQSRVPRLVVDNMGSPWITEPLSCVSDQEIVFEKGVEILAKRGFFTGISDALFSLMCVTNVTLRGKTGAILRMRRADYDAPPYTRAEWRHVLNIKSSVNIKVYGLTLAESGGDGIYLGSVRREWPNRDIHIKDVVCDRNYRQGISVISAENLLIENTVMRNTAGTPPEAGIDFEPNYHAERLKNCVMRDCVTENNKGDGYEFYLPNLRRTSEPVSVRLENCRSSGDRVAVRVITGNAYAEAVRGEILFAGCRFEKALRNGVLVGRKPASGIKLVFDRCVLADCAAHTNIFPDILLWNTISDEQPGGGILLDRMTILQPVARTWLMCRNNVPDSETVTALTGTVKVKQGTTLQKITLTPEWVKAQFPPRFPVRVPRVAVDLAKARVIDRAEGVQKLPRLRLRRKGTYVFYAETGKEAFLAGQQTQVGKKPPASNPLLVVRSPNGQVFQKLPLPPFEQRVEIRFTPAVAGYYTLEVDVGNNAFTLLEANLPVALDTTKKAASLIASAGTLFAAVPKDTGVFAFSVAGEGDDEAVKATVIDHTGKAVWTNDAVIQMDRFTATEGQGVPGGLWQVTFGHPNKGVFEDFHLEVLGIPGYLFLSRERYWEF